MYICSNCGSDANPYEVDKKLETVNGINYKDMRLCDACFEVTTDCALCDGGIITEKDSDEDRKLCHNCRCLFIYHTGEDPIPLNI